jgi:hypothetical protein
MQVRPMYLAVANAIGCACGNQRNAPSTRMRSYGGAPYVQQHTARGGEHQPAQYCRTPRRSTVAAPLAVSAVSSVVCAAARGWVVPVLTRSVPSSIGNANKSSQRYVYMRVYAKPCDHYLRTGGCMLHGCDICCICDQRTQSSVNILKGGAASGLHITHQRCCLGSTV